MSEKWVRYGQNIFIYTREDGTCTYRLQYYDSKNSKNIRKIVHPPADLNSHELKVWLEKERAEFIHAITHNAYSLDSKMTFSKYYETVYVKTLANKKPSYREWCNNIYKRVREWLGDIKLQDINRRLLMAFQAEMAEDGVGDSTRDACHRLISAVLSNALYDDIIPKNPARGPGIRPVKRKKPVKALRIEDVFKFLEAVDKHEGLYWRSIIYTIAYTFGRRGEVTALTWNDVDFEYNRIDINKSATKVKGEEIIIGTTKTGNSDRRLPMVEPLRLLLLELNEANQGMGGFLFKQRNNPMLPLDPDSISNHMRKFCLTHKLKICTPQILRHSGPSILRRAGVDVPTIKELLGHTDIRTTILYYLANDDEDKADAMGKFNTLLAKQKDKKNRLLERAKTISSDDEELDENQEANDD